MLSIVTSIITLIGMQFVKARRWEGWAIGLVAQAFWVVIILQTRQWGLFILTATLTWTYATALVQWRRA